MTTPNHPPLWREMAGAWSARVIVGRPDAERLAIAAEIRALRDWLLPEEGGVIPDGDLTEQAYRSDERAGLRALLTAEADRAERGDG